MTALVGRLHPSDIADWQGCGRRFELTKIDRNPPAWRHPAALNGTAIHSIIEQVHAERLWDADRNEIAGRYRLAFLDAIDRPKMPEEKGQPIWWGKHGDADHALPEFAADALEMIDGYRQDPRNREAIVLASEALWRATFGGFDWEGTLDQARAVDGGVEIVDLKSGTERLTGPAFKMWPQGLTYALALAHAVFRPLSAPEHAPWSPLARVNVRRVTWLHLRDYVPYKKRGKRGDGSEYRAGEQRGQALYSIEVTPQILDAHAKEIAHFARAVHAGQFERRPSNYQCSRCRVAERCLRDFGETIEGLSRGAMTYEGETNGEG